MIAKNDIVVKLFSKEKLIYFISFFFLGQICEKQRSGAGTTVRDVAAKCPYYVNTNTKLWVGFEDRQSVRDKV